MLNTIPISYRNCQDSCKTQKVAEDEDTNVDAPVFYRVEDKNHKKSLKIMFVTKKSLKICHDAKQFVNFVMF